MTKRTVKVVVTVPNQKVIIINHALCDDEHYWIRCSVESTKKAMIELKPNAFKLFMYFNLNQDDYRFALSSKDVHDITGMSEKTYQNAVNEMIEKGYLVKQGKQNLYQFYEGKNDTE